MVGPEVHRGPKKASVCELGTVVTIVGCLGVTHVGHPVCRKTHETDSLINCVGRWSNDYRREIPTPAPMCLPIISSTLSLSPADRGLNLENWGVIPPVFS